MTHTKKLVLQSDFSELEKVEVWLKELQAEIGFDEQLFSRVNLAVNEAASNGMVHGNQSSRSKRIAIEAVVESRFLSVSVTDEGSGFDFTRLPDPLADENLLKTGGRGLFIMKEYADEMHFVNNGATVILKFNLT